MIVSGVFFAGLFAGAETGIYQVSRLRLRLGIEKKQFFSVVLGKSLRDTPGLLTSTLVGTNIAIHLVTSTVTYIMLKNSGHSAEFLAMLITTPPLFIFSELIPKNLFFRYADTLMLRISPLLFGFYKILCWCGIIAIFKYISMFLAKLTNTPVPSTGIINAVQRQETEAFFRDIHEESILSKVQTDIVNRLLVASNTTVNAVKIPLRKACLVSVNAGRADVLNIIRDNDHTRLPVYEGDLDNITGFINVYEVLCSGGNFEDLKGFVKPVRRFPQGTLVTNAMEKMWVEKEKMSLVVRINRKKQKIPTGIITMKDLVEELFGELGSW